MEELSKWNKPREEYSCYYYTIQRNHPGVGDAQWVKVHYLNEHGRVIYGLGSWGIALEGGCVARKEVPIDGKSLEYHMIAAREWAAQIYDDMAKELRKP